MSKASKNKIAKSTVFFWGFTSLLGLVLLVVLAVNFILKSQALNSAESMYHTIDSVYGSYFAKETAKGISVENGSFGEDNYCYVGVIDMEGNVITYTKGDNASVSTDNIFKVISAAKVVDADYNSVVAAIQNKQYGRVEIYGGNQSRIIIYTPVKDADYCVVRVMNKRYFLSSREESSSVMNFATLIIFIFAIAMYILVAKFKEFASKIEDHNVRNSLIAADNNMVSFTYHSSIASFEMTGAVEQVFGAEVGKRGQIDWNTLSRMLHPDDQMFLRNISKAIKEANPKYTTEFRIVDSEGEFHWYRLNGKCILGERNEVVKFVGTIQSSDDQIAHENMLKNKAEHDLLTGLLNKITIQEEVDRVVKNNQYGVYAFYIIDLDNFKAVNDNLGHAVGDKVLTDVASNLQRVFNEADYIGRLGGDEFAVLLVIPSMMTSQADKLIREKAKQVNEIMRHSYEGEKVTINVSASVGISVYPDDGSDFQTLYQHADRALYHSKENGKDQFTFYTEVE